MIVVATSGATIACYCIVAHGAILRVYAKDRAWSPTRSRANHRKADISERRAMLALRSRSRYASAEIVEDADSVRIAHGFSDEDIWDIGAIAAFFALSNRMANLIAMRPNDEFCRARPIAQDLSFLMIP